MNPALKQLKSPVKFVVALVAVIVVAFVLYLAASLGVYILAWVVDLIRFIF